MSDRVGRCHDCTAPQTEVNMLSRHILELQKDKGELIDKCRELENENAELKFRIDDLAKMCNRANERHDNVADNLTKAKEIIKYLLSFIQKENYRTRWDINIAEAEQFIKDSEVEK